LLVNEQFIQKLSIGDFYTLAKAITIVENNLLGANELLQQLPASSTAQLIGITGAPGAGKSTLVNALLGHIVEASKRVAVISVDPSSAFNLGALLGDRIRMSNFYNHPSVYIRSLASRGALGGLHPNIYEVIDVCKAAGFDYIIIETVGVGQSEIDIAGLADTTIVVVVPEGGDEVQTLKSGVLEIADIFVVNKADRTMAKEYARNLRNLSHIKATPEWQIPVLLTQADKLLGTHELLGQIELHTQSHSVNSNRRQILLAKRLYNLIVKHKMKELPTQVLLDAVALLKPSDNIYRLAQQMAHI
jgi:LAO/AO transport system kinase